MDSARLILGIVFALITALLAVYFVLVLHQKGPILTNTYIWATKQQREQINKKAEYRLLSVIIGGLTVAALFETLYIFTALTPFFVCFWITLGLVLAYAIYDAVKTVTKP